MNSEPYNSQSNSEGGASLTIERIAKMLEGQPEPEPPTSKWFEDSHSGDINNENNRRGLTARFTHQTPPYRGGNLDRGRGRGRGSPWQQRNFNFQSGNIYIPTNQFGLQVIVFGPNNVPPPQPGFPQGYWNRNTPSQQSNPLKRGSESQDPYPDRKNINRSGSPKRNHLGANMYAPHAQQSQPSTSIFANFKPGNPNPGSQQRPPIKQESTFGGFNRFTGSAHLGSPQFNQSQPELLSKQESIFGSPSRSITQQPNATLHSNTSTFYNFKPAVSRQPPKVLPKEESIFGGYDRFAGNAHLGSLQPHQSQPRLPIKQESKFDGANGCIVQQPNVLLNAVTTTFGDFKPRPPLNALTQPLQEESVFGGFSRATNNGISQTDSRSVVNQLSDTYRQPRMSHSGAPHQPERALDNMIKNEEEEEPSQPSTSIPRPPKPVVIVTGNLLGDPSSPKGLKDRAKTEAICEKAEGPLPPTIQPKILPNGRKAGVFIDQEKKFRTTGEYQYFDPGCFNCGGSDHDGSMCKEGCYRCGKDHPLPQCPYNM
ncbi:uncharacterized protein EAE98_005415 [Botrytis deweyae]|uniref:CCHC-type domain-containing protein n=1 Tax=Botrytis deweyae TaxID=2478750 RepID=A0ABQ7INV4_9HELO|nr:uncharacterized protein EAE98_005415 [Botrytis deweyae]KAF7929497.1 hypothetical protein EAE98_005415 [Botrytis deweyae]